MCALRIAQVAPVAESVPPRYYGGVERIVSYLTEELVKNGHDVTLFASGDSVTNATLVPVRSKSLRLDDPRDDYLLYQHRAIELLMEQEQQYDIVHFHTEPLHFPFAQAAQSTVLTTLHGRLDLDHIPPLYTNFIDLPMVSI